MGIEKHKDPNVPIVEELPCYPSVETVTGEVSLPTIAQPILPVKKAMKLSKQDQKAEFGIDAAVAHINVHACLILEQASLAQYFDSFRAPVSFCFDSETILRLLWGDSQVQKARLIFSEENVTPLLKGGFFYVKTIENR